MFVKYTMYITYCVVIFLLTQFIITLSTLGNCVVNTWAVAGLFLLIFSSRFI